MKFDAGQIVACCMLVILSMVFIAAGIYLLLFGEHRHEPANAVGGLLSLTMAALFIHRVVTAKPS